MRKLFTHTVSVAISVALVTSGCATGSSSIASSYTSPMQFQAYDCEQLASEAQRLQARSTQLGARLDQAASNDAALMGVGLVLFWPALFALGGTNAQEAEYARMKGEHDAIQQSSVLKKCPGAVAQSAQTAQVVHSATPNTPTVIAADSTSGNPEASAP